MRCGFAVDAVDFWREYLRQIVESFPRLDYVQIEFRLLLGPACGERAAHQFWPAISSCVQQASHRSKMRLSRRFLAPLRNLGFSDGQRDGDFVIAHSVGIESLGIGLFVIFGHRGFRISANPMARKPIRTPYTKAFTALWNGLVSIACIRAILPITR
jgi:hypothetical protein